ncbi:MAG: glycosyltransferase family 4 protein [Gemmatimonas sp.]
MRILMWVSFYWPDIGGVETFTRQLAHALRKRGHEILVMAAHGRVSMPDESDDDGVRVHRFPFWEAIEKRDPVLMLQVQKRVNRIKQEFAPDIVHLNCMDASIFFQLRAADVARAPTVVTLHWTPPEDLWGHNSIVGQTLRQASWIAAISEHQMPMIDQALPECRDRASLFLNGLYAPGEDPSPPPLDRQQILCVGRHVRDKGFDLAIDAFARIAGDFPRATLVVAGDGIEREALIAQAQALGLASRIQFPGFIPHDSVPSAIAQSVMVVMPSRFEPFGLVALEAAHMQRPIVVSNVGGLPEIVADGVTGLVVPDENPGAIAAAMARLLHEPATAAQLGVAGRTRALQHFSADRNTAMYEALFQRLKTERVNAVAG